MMASILGTSMFNSIDTLDDKQIDDIIYYIEECLSKIKIDGDVAVERAD